MAMIAIFWTAAALLLYTYAGYPLWIFLRALARPRPWRRAPVFPTVSVILVVHNGAGVLQAKIDHLLTLDYPPERLELIAVSDGSTDATAQILRRNRLVHSIIFPKRVGKCAALNAGMRRASGEILVFEDIRPAHDSAALRSLVSNFADPQVGCAAGEVVLHEDGHEPSARAVGRLYWRYEQWIRRNESLLDSVTGVYGGFYAVRRKLAARLPDSAVLDDVLQPLAVIRQGYRAVVDVHARVQDVWPRRLRAEFQRKARTLAGNFQLLQLVPWSLTSENRLRFAFVSHKLLRLLGPALLVILAGASAELAARSRGYAALAAAQLLFYLAALCGARLRLPGITRLAAAARAFCMMNLAVVAGFYKFLATRGPLWSIWNPTPPLAPSSARRPNPNAPPAKVPESIFMGTSAVQPADEGAN
ncbi:MAG TPA: glycosyltransferase [Candidatus Acidoferrales bacterium]|nr:glycosyltransferase [Candidatus Acidoferrales bacterium]